MELGARVVARPTAPGTETVSAGFCARRPGGSSGRNGGVRGEAGGAGARRPSRRALGSLLPGFRHQREPCAQCRPPRRPRGSEPRGGRRARGSLPAPGWWGGQRGASGAPEAKRD